MCYDFAGVRRGGGGHDDHGEPVAAGGLHAAVHVVGHLHGGAVPRPAQQARLGLLKPLHYDLWLVSFAFLLFTGFAVWAVEHRVNEEFRGPPSYQIGTLLYFGFSTLVFAHSNY
ncbi:hypothetical protein EJB05_43130, partial [Eragrostis curvula]